MATSKKKMDGKTLVLLYDGTCWHGGLSQADGSWERMREEVPTLGNLPEPLLHWGLDGGALRVRVAVPAELFDLESEPGGDLTLLNPAELYQTLCYELSEPSGMEPEEIVPAATTSRELNMGADEGRIIGAALSLDAVRDMNELSEHHGLVFDGITSLQGLLLAAHSKDRDDPKEGLLFFGPKNAFVCGVPVREHRYSIRSVSGGCSSVGGAEDAVRRLERRLQSYMDNPLHLVVPVDSDPTVEKIVGDLAHDEVRCSSFHDLCPCLMELLTGASHYMLEGPVALVGLPPRVRDDKFTGGVICGSSILATVLVLGAMWGTKVWQKHSIETLKADIKALEMAQQSAASTFESVDSQIKSIRKLHTSLSQMPEKVSAHFTEIMLALSQTLPQYSRITSVVQDADCTRITGSTLWPQEVSGFSVALQNALNDSKLRVIPMAMTPSKDGSETLFEMEVR